MPVLSARLAVVGGVVFVANAGLLVLQLVAGPLLSPFIGSSLETWTAVIASFLVGIAAGNFLGGRIADRSPRVRTLGLFLALGGLAAAWMVVFPVAIGGGAYQALPLGPRIPVLALALCLPVAFTLSLLTPLAIRIAVPDAASTGRVAGLVFALSTLGCLLGNYLTGFVLIPALPINSIVLAVAGVLVALAGLVAFLKVPLVGPTDAVDDGKAEEGPAALALPVGFAIVFACSFAGMTLELSATRLIALVVGSSIYTWTGVIGVMLLGTACGNWFGGRLAGRAVTAPARAAALGGTLVAAGLAGAMVVLLFILLTGTRTTGEAIAGIPLRERILALTFALFFLPMAALGMVSPQVIRLCTTGLRTAGRTAGRVYAVSTVGAIAGTFATGYLAISALGVVPTILAAGVLPAAAMLAVAVPRQPGGRRRPLVGESGAMLYAFSVVLGAAFGGFLVGGKLSRTVDPEDHGVTEIVAETNYYSILIKTPATVNLVVPPSDALTALVGTAAFDVKLQEIREVKSPLRHLYLDHLKHSTVDLDDPNFFVYRHEAIQAEMLRLRAEAKPAGQNVLVIGGGGYTFPRAVRTTVPTAAVDVVEIDPGVTRVAERLLGLKPEWGIVTHAMDGRQFVSEKAAKGHYDLVTLDAVNDFSVPSHLLTQECNQAVKATLAPGGIYLVTVIDYPAEGLLWKAAFRTLKQTFAHVELLYPLADLESSREAARDRGRGDWTREETFVRNDRSVLVMYAADTPLDPAALRRAVAHQTREPSDTYVVPAETVEGLLKTGKQVILTDQYAPTDDLMRQVFDRRDERPPPSK